MLLWGGTFTAGKIAAKGAGPLSVAFLRFLLSALLLLPQLKIMEGTILPRAKGPKVWLLLGLSALTGLALYNYFFIRGLALSDAGRASVIVATNPAFIFMGTVVFYGERLSPPRVLGILLAILGTVLVVSSGSPARLLRGGLSLGDAFMLGCVLTWAAYSLLGKPLLRELSPLAATAWTSAIASAMLLPAVVASGEPLSAMTHLSGTTWAAIAFLGVGGTVLGFTFFYQGILRLGPNRAGAFVCLVPFFGILCGAMVFGEPVTLPTVGGLLISLVGLWIIQKC
jgi:drug/metabolite transporter (DMT)-like permease